MTQNNQTITAEQKVSLVLGEIVRRRDQVEALLPPDITFDAFHASINQALRTDPKILHCTMVSIVNACIESAYDGTRLDGKEAALVAHDVKISKNPDRYEKQAEYFPMVRGLIKKIIESGAAIGMEVDVIHRNDKHRIVRGTSPDIYHEPLLEGDRGPIIAAYSIALLPEGYRIFEFMTLAQIQEVQKEAKTDYVWKKWFGEMAKKTVTRRHEKRLPGSRARRDAEAARLFPQFQPAAVPALEAQPRPARSALPAPAQNFNYDLGSSLRDAEREEVRNFNEKQAGNQHSDRSPNRQDQRRETKPADDKTDPPKSNLPVGDEEWAQWEADLAKKIAACTTVEACNALCSQIRAELEAEQIAISDDTLVLFTDRLAELATDDGAGPAAASVQDNRAVETTS